jgi:hypothetical protein
LHFYQYLLGIRPVKKARPLVVGTAIHAALEAWWTAYKDGRGTEARSDALIALMSSIGELDEYTVARLQAMMVGYDARWSDTMAKIEVVAVEVEYRAPLRHPTLGIAADGWELRGKIDAIFHFRGRYFGVEHKTSAADLSAGSSYWARLRMDPQISAYFEAVPLGHELTGFIYDVMTKPKQRPLEATGEIKMTKGRRCGTKSKPCQGMECEQCDGTTWKEKPRPRAGQRETDETVDEYRERITAAICADPERYYHREKIYRLETEMAAARRDTWISAMQIGVMEAPPDDWMDATEAGTTFDGLSARYWPPPRNTSACHSYGGTCAFFSVCSTGAPLDSHHFERTGPHPELTGI